MKHQGRITIRWDKKRLAKFTQLCAKSKVSEIVRDILEAYLACQITAEEREELGLRPEWKKTEPIILSEALEKFSRSIGKNSR